MTHFTIAREDQQPDSFEFTSEFRAKVDKEIAKYPEGRQQSAVMALLDLAQRQHGWIPRPAIVHIAEILGMAEIRVWEVVSFYTMYRTTPGGRINVHVCTTTPCWLRGSDAVTAACASKLGIGFGEVTDDGEFALHEVECLGACVNAPILQVEDDYYEDLDGPKTEAILDALMRGETPTPGPQIDRMASAPVEGPTTLQSVGGDE